jgi:hypothetical protein
LGTAGTISGGRLTVEVTGEVEAAGGVLVVRRIHVAMRRPISATLSTTSTGSTRCALPGDLPQIAKDCGVCRRTNAIILVLRVAMSMTVKGVYRNGRIVLLETPKGVEEAEVVVTFPDTAILPVDATAREARRQLALKRLREGGWNLGGAPYPSRDELHDRTR